VTSQEGSIAAPKQGGLFEDLIEVLYAPSKVFDRARNSSAFKYALVTAIICLVVAVATKNLLMPWLDAQAELSIKMAAAKGKPIPDNAAASMRSFTAWGIIIGAPLTMLIGPYINAIFLLIGGKLMNARMTYAQAATIAVLGGVPRVIGWLLMPVQAIISDSSKARSIADLSIGPARFVDPEQLSPTILTLLGNLDIFRLWQIALTVIGVAIIGRVSKGTAVVVVIIMVGVGAILQLIPSALF
jgi:hypothetical protein